MAPFTTTLGLKSTIVLATAVSLHVTATPPRVGSSTVARAYKAEETDAREEAFVKAATGVKAIVWAATASELYLTWSASQPGRSLSVWSYLGAMCGILGGALRVWCYKLLGDRFTFELAQHSASQSGTPSQSPQPSHALVTSGPYAFVRHPSYIGALMAFHGALVLFLAPGSELSLFSPRRTVSMQIGQTVALVLAFCSFFAIPRRIAKEERMLREEFGDAWILYTQRVKWRMVPWVY